jgi:hypothetical protein
MENDAGGDEGEVVAPKLKIGFLSLNKGLKLSIITISTPCRTCKI